MEGLCRSIADIHGNATEGGGKTVGREGGVFALAQIMLSMLYLAWIHRSLNLGLDQ